MVTSEATEVIRGQIMVGFLELYPSIGKGARRVSTRKDVVRQMFEEDHSDCRVNDGLEKGVGAPEDWNTNEEVLALGDGMAA